MSRALLDVNVLIALLDSDHTDHRLARDWIGAEIAQGWASCAITQNGFVRVISQPGYPSPVSPSEGMGRLDAATATSHHEFWSCSVSLLDTARIDRTRIHGPRQVTDVYLLALAVEHGGKFVTFDKEPPGSTSPFSEPYSLGNPAERQGMAPEFGHTSGQGAIEALIVVWPYYGNYQDDVQSGRGHCNPATPNRRGPGQAQE